MRYRGGESLPEWLKGTNGNVRWLTPTLVQIQQLSLNGKNEFQSSFWKVIMKENATNLSPYQLGLLRETINDCNAIIMGVQVSDEEGIAEKALGIIEKMHCLYFGMDPFGNVEK